MSNETTSYHNFAYYYNQLIPQEFYEDYVVKINEIKQFNNIIDLACGSGTLCFLLKNDLNQVTGLDLSQEMLMIAQENNQSNKKGIQFINQDLNNLKLNANSYDLITCTLDSLNYIETQVSLNQIIASVANSLQSGGYFCFDVLSQFYLDEIVYNYYQCEELDDFEYVWQVVKLESHILEHSLQIITNEDCYTEKHLQYIYDFDNIEEQLLLNGLKIVKKEYEFNELNTLEPSRVYYFAQKER